MSATDRRGNGSEVASQSYFWYERPVLVTGAAGFLGGHVVDCLARAGASVVALVRDQPIRAPNLEATIVRGDLTDQALLERAMGEYEIATVFHLAAQSQVEVANRNPVSTFESNVTGTWSLLEAARRTETIAQVVLASSDKAYGSHADLPYREDMALRAVHPYDVSKACGDMIASSYHQVFAVPVSITRCANLYGPGDVNWARIVPSTARSLLRGEAPILRSDGSPIRDYLYVEDAAEGYLRLAESMADGIGIGEVFNLSAERPVSVLDLVRTMVKVAGTPELQPVVENRVRHEISEQHLSAAKARALLGWSARHTLEEGLAKSIAWYRRTLLTAPLT
jgi:CDP-glucose 4,6-dehydratase